MDAAIGPVDAEGTAATRDRRWRERTLRGEIHDYPAAAMDGEAGNAGLFATAPALARFARALLRAGASAGGLEGVLAPETVECIRSDAIPDLDSAPGRQGLGWRLADGATPAPTWSDAAFGHTGFTGASIWIDPSRDRFAVLLTTHLLPDDPEPMADLCERFHAAVGATRDAGASTGTGTTTSGNTGASAGTRNGEENGNGNGGERG